MHIAIENGGISLNICINNLLLFCLWPLRHVVAFLVVVFFRLWLVMVFTGKTLLVVTFVVAFLVVVAFSVVVALWFVDACFGCGW